MNSIKKAYYHLPGLFEFYELYEAFLPVYRKLHEEGAILIFDMGWDDELSFDKYGDYLRLADYYTPNTKEALKITGRDTPEEALRVLAEYFEHPLVADRHI